jgi:Holliday junction DNA helicase RuvB
MEDILSPFRQDKELIEEERLRPQRCEEFIGQTQVMENLKIFIEAARRRREPLDHALIYGPPGLGKTTIAYIIANELGTRIKATSGPAIERKDDLAAILTDLRDGDVLFIDEIHRLNRIVEECLYPAMEEFKIDIIIGEGPHAKSIKLDLSHFTLVGATTRAGMLTSPLRTRFGITERLHFYGEDEMLQIVKRSARILAISVEEDGAREISRRSRGTPRIANRLLRRVRDFADVKADGRVTGEVARAALKMFEVDELGLDIMDRQYLLTIMEKFSGGPVGINTIAVALSEDQDTIEDIFEPFLIQVGFVNRTPKGRVVTPKAYKHLGKPRHKKAQDEIF